MSWLFWAALSLVLAGLGAVGLVLTEVVHARPYESVEAMRQCPHCRRRTHVEGGILREHFISPGIACRGDLRKGSFTYEE